MNSQDNARLIRNFYSAMEKNDLKQVMSLMSPNAEFKIIGMDKPFRGQKEITESFNSWNQAFPDMKTEIVNLIATDDWVVVETTNRGSHEGPMETPSGPIQATHRKVDVPACDLFKIVNGKIATWNCYWQSDVMMKQLGLGVQKAAA